MSKYKEMLLILGFGFAAMAAQHATAQSNPDCAPRQQVLEQLTEKYGETRQSIGLSTQQTVVELFASRTSGSWTITVTLPNGMTCLVASGMAFESFAAQDQPAGPTA